MVTTEQLSSALAAVCEGLRLNAYRDSGGVLTIGIGHTGPEVQPGLIITAEMALQLFCEDQKPLLDLVEGKPLLEAAALVDFGFNCGRKNLLDLLKGKTSLADPKHTTDRHGNVLGGLVARRRLESLLIQISKGAS